MEIQTSQIIQSIRNKFIDSNVASAMIDIKTLVASPLKPLDYQRISQLIDEYRSLLLSYLGGRPLKLAILGGYTTQPIAVALRIFLLAEWCLVDVYESEYNSYKTEVLNPESGLYVFKPDFVLFAVGSININNFPAPGSADEQINAAVNAFVEEYRNLWSMVKKQTNAIIIQHTFEPFEEKMLGRLEYKYSWSPSRFKQRINERLWELDGREMHLLDVYGLSIRIGIYNWFEPRWYCYGKYGYDPKLTFEYGRLFVGLWRAIIGKTKKCLVTDLDNTLWGGLLGDDGIDGIHIGNISPQGEAYKAFCLYLKRLKSRGVILAVCSKNDPILAKEVFTKHPEMPLELDDFASFYCNWESKSLNLSKIAKELNIGMDALVFIDDNPVECAEVREITPEVEVIEMGGDPAYFIRKIDMLHLFDQLDITSEDLKRTDSYVSQVKIKEMQRSFSSLEEFLSSLNMVGRVCPATLHDVPRIKQMFKKTNQFNLTSRRYDDVLLEFIEGKDKFCLSCWLKDRFVDYGLVSVVIGCIKENKLEIDNWVMSCRVFSRMFEQFIFNQLIMYAKEWNCFAIYGEFVPTAKNNYVNELFKKLGFTAENDGGKERWVLNLQGAVGFRCYIKKDEGSND